ncbi:hypothetical protein lacNasYZ03_00190 [Lactobacillus nasalidis]|uniref:Uncharacterized protein n=1 Tax=Lactobacillus nasalidis TaxID=2797258 RepID=A0ABQ3W610_9LACO|nr:hypothetical protein lacNasYZ01_16860 [Lactobacillus nasalidis]GHV99998.1 hypothetical protein lacNasYZ02_14280 [Lactobacillus nasalidis]GHW00332.1 hypothetical protein lacNasYZ03_00190 [Lactobacillus nasalidis]
MSCVTVVFAMLDLVYELMPYNTDMFSPVTFVGNFNVNWSPTSPVKETVAVIELLVPEVSPVEVV